MKIIKHIPLGFGVIGLILLSISGLVFNNTRTFINNSVTTTGRIIEMHVSYNSDHERVYYPVVEFRTPREELVTFTSGLGSSNRGNRLNEPVPVRYDPEDPKNAEIDSFSALWTGFIVLIILGLSFTGVGFPTWFFFFRHVDVENLTFEKSLGRLSVRL